ncbi:DUF6089 family protein [Bacteroidales bacterium OttesenSCG-928-I21]|nr:DUF6089 family protein [Bacteroidales bacterium OttesenSCG-928-I21]
MFFVFVIPTKHSIAQQGIELGAQAGVSYYIGDINLHKHFYSPNVNIGGFFKFHFDKRSVLRLGAFYTELSAADKDFKNQFQQLRNHSFKMSLVEINLMYEVHFLPYLHGSKRKESFTPYLQLGLATYISSSLEKKANLAIPIGVGIKKNLTARLVLGVEWSFRKTFSDYLDSLSGEDIGIYDINKGIAPEEENTQKQKATRYTKDWYSMACVTLSYTFKVGGLTCKAYYNY